MDSPQRKVGRPPNEKKVCYIERYHLTPRMAKNLTSQFLTQLEQCKDEASRRILLGKSK